MFHVGQKVVCINEVPRQWWADELCLDYPVKGAVYTVRRVVQRHSGLEGTAAGVMLEEVLNMPTALSKSSVGGYLEEGDPNRLPPDEVAFWVGDFRPLVTIEKFVKAAKTVDA